MLLAACKPMPMEESAGTLMDWVHHHRQFGFWEVAIVRKERSLHSDFELWVLDTYTEQKWLLHGSVGYTESVDYSAHYPRETYRMPETTYLSPNGRQLYFFAAGTEPFPGKLAHKGSLWVTDGSPSGTRMLIDFRTLYGIDPDEYIYLESVTHKAVYLHAVHAGCTAKYKYEGCSIWVRVDLSSGERQIIPMPNASKSFRVMGEREGFVYASDLYNYKQPAKRGYYTYDLQIQEWRAISVNTGRTYSEIRREGLVATYIVKDGDLPSPRLFRLDMATGQEERLPLPQEDVTWMEHVEWPYYTGERFGIVRVELGDGSFQLWRVDEFGQVEVMMQDARGITDIVVGENGGFWSTNRNVETSYWIPPYNAPVVTFENGAVVFGYIISLGDGRYVTEVRRGSVAGDAGAAIIDPVRGIIEPIETAPGAKRPYSFRQFKGRENYVLYRAHVGELNRYVPQRELRYYHRSASN